MARGDVTHGLERLDELSCIYEGKGAKLLGVEYIVSDKLFQTLPAEEKKSGTRTAPRC